jgi:hypothetical protein
MRCVQPVQKLQESPEDVDPDIGIVVIRAPILAHPLAAFSHAADRARAWMALAPGGAFMAFPRMVRDRT